MRKPVNVPEGYRFGATPYPLLIKNPDGTTFGWKHGGQDYSCAVGTQVVAPHAGTVTFAGYNGTAGYEVRIVAGNVQTRLLHNSVIQVRVGQVVKEGQNVALSGRSGFVTGPHVHWYLSINGKYVDPVLYITPPTIPKPPSTGKMPTIGSSIKILKGYTRTTYKAGTTTVAGTIRATDESFIYQVRGYDPKYGYRILINSASGGGNGVALALYYTNGNRVEGWQQV